MQTTAHFKGAGNGTKKITYNVITTAIMKASTISLLPFALMAVCGHAQDLQKHVSISMPASRAKVVMEKLSQVTGTQLSVSNVLADEVLLVSVKDVTVDELMQRIARAEVATWSKSGDGYILGRDPGVGNTLERAEVSARANSITAAVNEAVLKQNKEPWTNNTSRELATETHALIDELKNGMRNSTPPNPGTGARSAAVSGKTPASRAIVELIKSLDAGSLAAIPVGGRVVFSTNATPMQLRMSNQGAATIKQFVDRQRQYVDAYSATEPQDGSTNFFSFNGLGTPNMGDARNKPFAIGLLVVTRSNNNSLDFQLTAADQGLDEIASGNYSLSLVQQNPPAQHENAKKLPISDLAKEVAKAGGGNARGGFSGATRVVAFSVAGAPAKSGAPMMAFTSPNSSEKLKVSEELRKRAMEPDLYDPLSYGPGEAYSGYADLHAKNLVAALPDSSFVPINQAISGDRLTDASLAEMSEPLCGVTLAEDEKWIVGTLSLPASARASRADRKLLKNLQAKLAKQGTFRLDDVSTYAYQSKAGPIYNGVEAIFMRIIDSPAADRDFVQALTGNYLTYKFYGSLSGPQRETAWNGGRIALMNLSAEQLGIISQQTFGLAGYPYAVRPIEPRAGVEKVVTASFISTGGGVPFRIGNSSVKDERTILLPNGITRDGYIEVSVNKSDAVLAMNSQSGAATMMDANALGFNRYSATDPNFNQGGQTYDRFRMGSQSTLSFTFHFTDEVMSNSSLTDSYVDPNASGVTYEQLPDDFRKRAEDAAARLKDALSNRPLKGGGQSAPPPQK